jgi:hypothetical protein
LIPISLSTISTFIQGGNMKHQTNNKSLFQMALFTLFSSLLFVGIVSVTCAQAEILTGQAKVQDNCDDGSGGIEKDKFKLPVEITVNTDNLPFILGSVVTEDADVSGAGLALAKNAKSGIIIFNGDDGAGVQISLIGNYKTNKNTGEVVLISGSFTIQEETVTFTCIITAKFKVKLVKPLP